MSNGLKVTVRPDDFSVKTTDEKLELIYQAVLLQQSTCTKTVKGFKDACERYDHFIVKSRMLDKLSKRDKGIILGAGIGTGTLGGITLLEIIEYIKGFFCGG